MTVTVIQSDPHLTPPISPGVPAVEPHPVQPPSIRPRVLENYGDTEPGLQGVAVTVSDLTSHKPVHLAQLPVIVLRVEFAGPAALVSSTDHQGETAASVIPEQWQRQAPVHPRARNGAGLHGDLGQQCLRAV